MKYSHDNHYSGGNHYELLVKMKKLSRTVACLSNFMKATLTNNDQELTLDLSQYAAEAHVPESSPTEDDVTKKGNVQVNVSSPINLVYTTDEEIIYIQNMPIYEDDSDEPTADININTPDHENVNEDTQDRDYIQDESQNDSEEEVDEEEILVSQKEINEALNNIKPGKKIPTWLYKGVKRRMG